MNNGDLTTHSRKGMGIRYQLFALLIALAMAVNIGAASVTPDFISMNQANKTLTGNGDFIANGDYLYLFDNSTTQNVSEYNWTVKWTGQGDVENNVTKLGKNVMYGPFVSDNFSNIAVDLHVSNDSPSSPFYATQKVFQVLNRSDYMRADFSYLADYFNKSAAYPNGTLTFRDTTRLQVEPPDMINQWWWQISSDNGLISDNWSGTDSVTIGLYNCTSLNVNLTTQSEFGNVSSVMEVVDGMPGYIQPSADFTAVYRNGTSPQVVAFIDQSTALTNLSYLWNFGDNYTSHERNPEHIYLNRTDPYSVNLMVTDNFGTVSSLNKPEYIKINESPIQANFTAAIRTGTAPLRVSFIDQSTSKLPITSYEWNFGDNFTSDEQNPEHVYNVTGNYTVNLTVANDAGVSRSELVDLIHVTHADDPIGMFTATLRKGAAPLNVSFIDQSKGTPPLEYNWDFGDETPLSFDQNPVHVYDSPGLYNVTMQVTGPRGSDVVYLNNYIEVTAPALPVASFIPVPRVGKVPLNVSFIDQSSGVSPLSYDWDFGDGNSSSDKAPMHQFAEAGTYLVSLTITDGAGQSSVATDSVVVSSYSAPLSLFTASPVKGEVPLSVSFIDLSCHDNCNYQYDWDFGDGNRSSKKNPVYTYKQPGTYTTNLTTIDVWGVRNLSESIDIVIYEQYSSLKADFTSVPASGNPPLSVLFMDQSVVNVPNVSYYWTFGQEGSSELKSPSYNYLNEGNFTVNLTLTGADGEISSNMSKTVQVEKLDAEFDVNVTNLVSDRYLVELTDFTKGFPSNWYWSIGDAQTKSVVFSSSDQNISFLIKKSGSYIVTLNVWNERFADTESKSLFI